MFIHVGCPVKERNKFDIFRLFVGVFCTGPHTTTVTISKIICTMISFILIQPSSIAFEGFHSFYHYLLQSCTLPRLPRTYILKIPSLFLDKNKIFQTFPASPYRRTDERAKLETSVAESFTMANLTYRPCG